MRASGLLGAIVRFMNRRNTVRLAVILSLPFSNITLKAQQPAAPATAAPKSVVGAIATIDASGREITIKTDSGDTFRVKLSETTKIQKVAPGQTIKDTAPMTFDEMAVGDRAIAAGAISIETKTVAANRLVVMTKGDLAKKSEKEQQDWAKRGSSGVVVAAKPESNEVTIQTKSMMGASKDVTVVVGEKTNIRRYAADSIKFQDAKPAKLAEIAKGDQIRIRGDKSPEGDKISAEEVVFGTFQLVGGQITEVSTDSVKIKDLATKKTVTVKITADSQLHKMPETMARMMATRLNGGGEEGGAAMRPAGGGPPGGGAPGGAAPGGGQRSAGGGPGGPAGGMRGGGGSGGGDMMERMPKFQLSELKVGDAVIILSSKGTSPDLVTAVSMLSGVEPILTAPARGRDPMAGMMSGMMGNDGGLGGGNN